MKAALLSLSLFAGLAFVALPCAAQQTQIMNTFSDARSPIEHTLQNELAMPGMGISASRNQIMNRFQYALDHKWLTSAQVQDLCNDLKTITDREESSRDANGKLSYESRALVAKQLNALNDRFEQLVLSKEQSRSNIDGLRARRAVIIQKVSKAESDGILTSKDAEALNFEITAAGSPLKRKQLSEDELKATAEDLSELDKRIDEQLVKAAEIAAAPPPPPGPMASLRPKLEALKPKLAVKPTMDAIKPKLEAMKPKLNAMKPRLDAMKPKLDAIKPKFAAMHPARIKTRIQEYYTKATGTQSAAGKLAENQSAGAKPAGTASSSTSTQTAGTPAGQPH